MAADEHSAPRLEPVPGRRFRHLPDDVLVRVEPLEVGTAESGETWLRSQEGERRTRFPRAVVETLLEQIDGVSTATEVGWRVARTRRLSFQQIHRLTPLIDELLPTAILLPGAIAELERRIRGYTIARLPISPYNVMREYWSNAADARIWIADGIDAAVRSADGFASFLRGAHVLSILGAERRCYYRPTSDVAEELIGPGCLRTLDRFPRSVPHGALHREPVVTTAYERAPTRFAHLLASLWGDPVAARGESLQDSADLRWGRGMFLGDRRESWYEPPAEVEPRHLEELRAQLAAALRPGSLDALAEFLRRFLQLHPFMCVNQSLALNIVNHVLDRTVGRQVPHLGFDALAGLLAPENFARAFRRSVEVFGIDRGTASPYGLFAQRLPRQLRMIEALHAAGSDAERSSLLSSEPEVARLLLLAD